MQTLLNVPGLCERLSKLAPSTVVGIEGFMGSGKTQLANELAGNLACVVLHIDDYLVPQEEELAYAERLNYDLFRAALQEGLRKNTLVLIEGICLRQVVTRLSVAPALFVYVMRMSVSGLWHDGFHLADFEATPNSEPEEVHRSDFRYHSSIRPHEQAQLLFHRIEWHSEV